MIDVSIAQPKLPVPWRDVQGHNDLTGYLAVKISKRQSSQISRLSIFVRRFLAMLKLTPRWLGGFVG